eukprot:Skav205701  [mRNA]  locus=scaffold2824:18627:19832:- [translate_table: standard]
MADASLEDILQHAGVDPDLASSLVAEGWSRETFAVAAVDLDRFEDVLPELSQQPLSVLQKAKLRAAFQSCRLPHVESASASSQPPAAATPTPASGSWIETFAPKLEPSVIQSLKSKFLSNYPSELLTPDLMPSTRLLSLVYNQLNKKNWVWIPWKLRMSVSKSEDVQTNRAQKTPKLEGLSLHELLVDEPPSIEISNGSMGLHGIKSLLDIHDRAIAICQGAHLANLKAFSQKFIGYLAQKVDQDSNLRVPTVTEAQSADRQMWHVMAELVNEKGWQLDDALHELTHIRHDMPSLLQLRPKAPKPQSTMPNLSQAYNPKGEPKGKGKGKGKKGVSKGKPRVQWVTDLKVGDTWRQLCMRYQTGKCTAGSNCAFYHGCAYPVEGGKACGLPHGALAHKATPH